MSGSGSRDDEELTPTLSMQLAEALTPAELSADRRERLRDRLLERVRDQPPEGTSTLRSEASPWLEIAPFIEVRLLRRDTAAGTHTALLRMRPGGVIPAHRHSLEEEYVILEGECQIGSHTLRAGDIHIAGPGSWHEAVTTQTGVLALLRGEYPFPTGEHAHPAPPV